MPELRSALQISTWAEQLLGSSSSSLKMVSFLSKIEMALPALELN